MSASAPRYYFDATGQAIPDPWATLGLSPGADSAAITAAYREKILAHPPETDRAGFEKISAAYRVLTAPEEVITRELRFFTPIDPAILAPPTSPSPAATSSPATVTTPQLPPTAPDAETFLAGELLLYACLHLLSPLPPPQA